MRASWGHPLPDDVLALLAAKLTLFEERFAIDLDRIVEHTRDAHGKGCRKSLIAFGVQQHDGIYLCSSVKATKVPVLVFFDLEDKDADDVSLVTWLETLVEEAEGVSDNGGDDDETRPAPDAPKVAPFEPALVVPSPKPVLPRVRHAVFGEGDVVREIADGTLKMEVRFECVGRKVLLASVLERLS